MKDHMCLLFLAWVFFSYFRGDTFGKIIKGCNQGIKRCLHTGMPAYTCMHTCILYLGLKISLNYFEEIN